MNVQFIVLVSAYAVWGIVWVVISCFMMKDLKERKRRDKYENTLYSECWFMAMFWPVHIVTYCVVCIAKFFWSNGE